MSDHDQEVEEAGAGGGGWTGTPRWVKVSAIVVGLLVLLLVIVLLAGGDHSPSRHLT